MLVAMTMVATTDTAAMMKNCERQESWNIGSVQAAISAASTLAPTGPQVQEPKAYARPSRGEKSRMSGAVLASANPSTNDNRTRAPTRWSRFWTAVISRQHPVVSSIIGTRA
jgi:hypothetical protein